MARQDIDLHSLDDVITALYAAISGGPGEQDWDLAFDLYHPAARLVRTGLDEDGKAVAHSFSPEEYRDNARALLKDLSFYEIEIAKRIERFGNIANVFSAYEAKRDPHDTKLIKRGMNMIHLYDDGRRWWIMHIIWDDEREGVTLPLDLFSASGHA